MWINIETQKKLERGLRLRELLKQSQNSPISVENQVALIYIGVNGYLDDIPVNEIKKYVLILIEYLNIHQKKYSEIIKSTNRFDDEAEILLKNAVLESKKELKN